ncbi:hypothetical protein [uncultured Clostridium sp.]|uniref:hypothetical protein n=1 Tax=uncultured Clostridium sp. TaxID=59620 RepID=UPI0025CCBF20|nr:hypothetical protein [uncultured Clostridium sp.]
MTLNEAIEILKTEKAICDLKISNGNGSKNSEQLSQAVDVITGFIEQCISVLVS